MTAICIFTISIYGHSGTELMPPVVSSRALVKLQWGTEDLEAFQRRMQVLGMAIRNRLGRIPPKPYSLQPSCGWVVYPEFGDLEAIMQEV